MSEAEKVQQVMNQLEKETVDKVARQLATGTITKNALEAEFDKQSEKFKQQVGREMTYSEMRQMFG